MNHAPTLGEMVRTFKALSARAIREARFRRFAWQRNYDDRIIRGPVSLDAYRRYIALNPARWADDEENADRR